MNYLLLLLILTLHPASIPAEMAHAIDAELARDSLAAATHPPLPYLAEIMQSARRHHLPPALLAAIIQEESRFRPYATRTEPRYKRKRLIQQQARQWCAAHSENPTYATELDDRSRSIGLMQVMGQTAREQGFAATYLAELYQPQPNIEQGAILLERLLRRYPHDTLSAISSYNQGQPRKECGIFANARYVYRVVLAWRGYEGRAGEVWRRQYSATSKNPHP